MHTFNPSTWDLPKKNDTVLPEAHSYRWALRGLDTTFSSTTPDKLTKNTTFYGGPPPPRSHRRDEATDSDSPLPH